MGLLSSLFRKPASVESVDTAWWARAEQAAGDPTGEAIAELRASIDGVEDPDEAERQREMIDGLERLIVLAARPGLPRIDSQHRVIASDVCHFAAPAGLAGDHDTPGKVLLTSRRIVFAGGTALAWPWHRVREVLRVERDLLVAMAGDAAVRVRFNSYADALEARWIAHRLLSS